MFGFFATFQINDHACVHFGSNRFATILLNYPPFRASTPVLARPDLRWQAGGIIGAELGTSTGAADGGCHGLGPSGGTLQSLAAAAAAAVAAATLYRCRWALCLLGGVSGAANALVMTVVYHRFMAHMSEIMPVVFGMLKLISQPRKSHKATNRARRTRPEILICIRYLDCCIPWILRSFYIFFRLA